MSAERSQIETAIAALEAQRDVLGDAVVDASQAALRAQLAVLAAAGAEPAQALKQVSILFLDVVGSTTLSQHLDPEAISGVMDDALARGTAIVEAHRGKVLQYAGDNILAAFGADEVREDDAERAVRCGLALLALGSTLGAEVHLAHGHEGFNVRVGVHTGSVLLGGGVDAEGSIRGIAVNIAARMEQTAPAGTLRISQDTYEFVRGIFETDEQPPLTIKGVDAPVRSYLVTRARPRSFYGGTRGIEGVATRMVGRGAELEALQAAFRRLFTEPQLTMITVVAQPGIGKSRLLYEFEAWRECRPERVVLFRGRTTPQTGARAFGLLREILFGRFQIADDDPLALAREKLANGIVPLFVDDDGPDLAEGHAHLLGHLIGLDWRESPHLRGILDDPRQIRGRAQHAAARLFRRIAVSEGVPLVLELEDLHWADQESLAFLDYLAELSRDLAFLILASTRPSLFERHPHWGSTDGPRARIDLEPLNQDLSKSLADELLKRLPAIPTALREMLLTGAEGNPFYMEELVKMLIDRGAILTGATWAVDLERLSVTRIPTTLTGVLQARLDGLPADERRALQQASVAGAVFWDQALKAIDADAPARLPSLSQRELTLAREDAPLEGLREYAFRHHVLHQVTYDTVLKRHKREGHARVGRWLASLSEDKGLRTGDFPGLAADHFERAGEDLLAAEFHALAAEQASERFAHERVLDHVSRALSLLGEPQPAQAELRWRLLMARETTLDLQGQREAQAADLDALATLADVLADERRRVEVTVLRSHRAMCMGDLSAQESMARDGMARATQLGDQRLKMRALRLLVISWIHKGDLDRSRSQALEGLMEAQRLGLRDAEAGILNLLSLAAVVGGDIAEAVTINRQSLALYRALGHRTGEARTQINLGADCMRLGALEQASDEISGALKLLNVIGDRAAEGFALCVMSTVKLWTSQLTQARDLARLALDIAVSTSGRAHEMSARLALGDAELALGSTATARESFSLALELAVELDSLWRYDATAALARVCLDEGNAAMALATLDPIFKHASDGRALDGTQHPHLIGLSCYRALKQTNDPRASAWLKRTYEALTDQAAALTLRQEDAMLRQSFLSNIPHHREILAEWARGP